MTDLPFEPDLTETPPTRKGLGLGGILLLLGVAAIALVFGLALARKNQTQPTAGPAPDFTLTTLDGGQINLASLKGRVWWSTFGRVGVALAAKKRLYWSACGSSIKTRMWSSWAWPTPIPKRTPKPTCNNSATPIPMD